MHQVRSVLLKLGHVPTACWAVVLNLAALDRAIRAGILYPRWFPDLAPRYGQPVLSFSGSLNYCWGLPFKLVGAKAALALKLVLATGLIAAGLVMYLLGRVCWDRCSALVAADGYASPPHHLADLYLRAAVAQLLAFRTNLAPGCHLLWDGIYEHDTVHNLAVRPAEAPAADRRILAGETEVVAP